MTTPRPRRVKSIASLRAAISSAQDAAIDRAMEVGYLRLRVRRLEAALADRDRQIERLTAATTTSHE